ncbi:MAG TPA: polysaccharide biosynthesis/export family protein [Terracidiphilus sp.]|nr:polysaccharide biosynthesis/export family protein [Terracidiphilus sp.]
MQMLLQNRSRKDKAVRAHLGQSTRLLKGVRKTLFVIGLALIAGPLFASSQSSGATSPGSSVNLPIEQIGPNDLIALSVYDSPELSRTFRISSDGTLRLPMLPKHLQASGLYPEQLEKEIRKALIDGGIFVDPIVTVTVAEYRSRSISVIGAVHSPITFQDTGNLTLIDAITQAGGLADNAGQEILVSHQQTDPSGKTVTLTERIPARSLLDTADSSLNLPLHGGEVIRVPEAGHFYVVGDVKNPGSFEIKDGNESSVLKALALTHGLDHYSSKTAYIYRTEAGKAGKNEIEVPLKKIIKRESPDVPLMANDIFYVPESGGKRATAAVLGKVVIVAVAIATASVYFIYR